MLGKIISIMPYIILLILLWSLLVGVYADLSQPKDTARIYSTTGDAKKVFGSEFSHDASRFHEFALLSAVVYGPDKRKELQEHGVL